MSAKFASVSVVRFTKREVLSDFILSSVYFLSFSVGKVTNTCLSLLALYKHLKFLDMDTS